MSEPTPLVVSDMDLASAVARYWPEAYRRRMMTAIFLTECNGNTRAIYFNTTGDFANTLDRGVCAINEASIRDVLTYAPDPRWFADVDRSVFMAKSLWDWRMKVAQTELGKDYGQALVWAYGGWSVYRHKDDPDPKYDWIRKIWPDRWRRAGEALTSLGLAVQ